VSDRLGVSYYSKLLPDKNYLAKEDRVYFITQKALENKRFFLLLTGDNHPSLGRLYFSTG
jgi:hypothetical protein